MHRGASLVRAQSGQGFGNAKPASKERKNSKAVKGGIKSGDSKAVQRALKLVEQQEGKERHGGGTRPIDAGEAARGKVEFVRVKDWGSGEPRDLGSLQVESQAQAEQAGGSPGQPFHEALARRLELLHAQGAISTAQPRGSAPLPEFQRWAFAREHYLQYLADLHAVHSALEESITSAAASAAAAAGEEAQRLRLALAVLGPDLGLARSEALLQDIAALERQQPSGGSELSGSARQAPTQHAAAYAAYLSSLARQCRTAEGAAELEQAVLRLLANAYVLLLVHLTNGNRVAAPAVEKLQLAAAGALATYSAYPALDAREGAGADPLQALFAAFDRLGGLLGEDQREELMGELARAMGKSSSLLGPLAREA